MAMGLTERGGSEVCWGRYLHWIITVITACSLPVAYTAGKAEDGQSVPQPGSKRQFLWGTCHHWSAFNSRGLLGERCRPCLTHQVALAPPGALDHLIRNVNTAECKGINEFYFSLFEWPQRMNLGNPSNSLVFKASVAQPWHFCLSTWTGWAKPSHLTLLSINNQCKMIYWYL